MTMITFTDIQTVLSNTFFNGDLTYAGLAIFVVVMAVIFAVTRNVFQSLLIGLPIVMIFSGMGILSGDMTILLIIITVLGLAMTAKRASTK